MVAQLTEVLNVWSHTAPLVVMRRIAALNHMFDACICFYTLGQFYLFSLQTSLSV